MKNQFPKVLIGTLFCGEGDFSSCKKAIEAQKNVLIEHFVIKDKKEQDAHNELWATFSDASSNDNFDFFTKIDADTILDHESVIETIAKIFNSNARITGIQAPLYDYFTDDFINGLNSFRPSVRFNSAPQLWCDRADTNHDIIIPSYKVPNNIRPAGLHCFQATLKQSFHYGLHRKLKNQTNIILKVKSAWEKHNFDRTRGFALIGALLANQFSDFKDFDYNDSKFNESFEYAQNEYDNLIKEIK